MQDFARDFDRVRVLEVGANKVKISKEDPYGFWFVSYERGPVPEVLSGAYTSYNMAEDAVKVYLQSKNREIKNVSK